MKHLWEVEHDYYCSESNYFSGECYEKYDTMADFLSAEDDADLDMNLVFRWDWREGEDNGAGAFNGDPYYRNGILQVFWMGQRKGIFRCTEVSVCRADEASAIKFLKPRLKHLMKLWGPLQ